jgi:hypothetical protein
MRNNNARSGIAHGFVVTRRASLWYQEYMERNTTKKSDQRFYVWSSHRAGHASRLSYWGNRFESYYAVSTLPGRTQCEAA